MGRACVDGLADDAIAGKVAWVRADLNVPTRAAGDGGRGVAIADAARLAAAAPTVRHLLGRGARVVVVASHFGRPPVSKEDGTAVPDPAFSLAFLAPALAAAVGVGAVTFVPASTGPDVAEAVAADLAARVKRSFGARK